MNKVIIINLNGIAYQLEEDGYEALRRYLDAASRRLEGNPDKDEIIADIEQSIADKFRAVLGAYKTVVVTKEVLGVIAEMGPVADASEPAAESAKQNATGGQTEPADSGSPGAAGGPKPARRLYRIHDGAMISGVCNGLAAYFNIDVTFVRLGFVILFLTWGAGLLVYILMSIIVPAAETPAEKAAATGAAATAQEFIRRAKAGYYEGFKTFHDKEAHRAWKKKFKQDVRGWTQNLQREVQENAYKWVPNWQQHSAQPAAPHPRYWVGVGFTLLVLKWVRLLCLALMIYAIYSLATHGHVFGLWLPYGIPVWIGIIAVVMAYQLVCWPIKAMRYSYYHPGVPHWGHAGPLDGLVWLGFAAGMIWLADHYSPSFHDWLQDLPPAIHHAADSVKEWWSRR